MPQEQTSPPEQRPRFVVQEPFMGVIVVQMNHEFCNLLQHFVDAMDAAQTVGPEVWAFRRALGNPAKSRKVYEEKKQQRSVDPPKPHP